MDEFLPFVESAHNLVTAIRDGRPTAVLESRFAGRAIVGDVDLSGVDYPHRLVLRGCTFWGRFTAEEARFGKTVDLSGCRFEQGLLMEGATVGGRLDLSDTRMEAVPGLVRQDKRIALSLLHTKVTRDCVLTSGRFLATIWLLEFETDAQLDLSGLTVTDDDEIELQGARIGTDLYCRNLSTSEPRPAVGGRVCMYGTTVGGQADFSGADIRGDLDIQNAEIRGDLFCRSLSESEPRPTVGGRVRLYGTTVGGQADFSGADIGGDLELQATEIGDSLFCRSLSESEPRPTVCGDLLLRGITVGGDASFSGADIRGDLDIRCAEIGGNLFCGSRSVSAPRPAVGGRACMYGTTVGGQADFSGADIRGDLDIQDTEIGGNLFCDGLSASAPRAVVGGRVELAGTTVGGQASFCGAVIGGDLYIQGAEIGEDLLCRSLSELEPRPTIGGRVRLAGTTVGGQASFCGAKIGGNLFTSSTVVSGHFFAASRTKGNPSTEITGDVDMGGIRVDGITSFIGAQITGRFLAHRAEFDDGLYLAAATAELPDDYRGDRPTRIAGGVDLVHVRVNGLLSLSGLDAEGPIGLHDAHIDGDLDARSTKSHPTRLGRVTADNLTVLGTADFSTAAVVGPDPDKPCLDFSFAEVQGDCLLPGSDTVKRLTLYHAKLGEVRFAGDHLPSVVADGMTFRRLALPGNDYVAFLDRTDPFLKENYRAVETHLREQGQDDAADRVFREMHRRDRRDELGPLLFGLDVWLFEGLLRSGNPRYRRLIDGRTSRPANVRRGPRAWLGRGLRWAGRVFVLDALVGYGTKSVRLGVYLVGMFLFLWFLFAVDGRSVKRELTPSVADAARHKPLFEQNVYPADVAKEWGAWDAVWVAARVSVPLVDPFPDREWQPSDQPVDWQPLRAVGLGWRPLGWLFTYEGLAGLVGFLNVLAIPLFLVSLSGWLKRRGD